jgi:hypothetical protein
MATAEVNNIILALEKTYTQARQARNESHCLSIAVHEKSPVEGLSPSALNILPEDVKLKALVPAWEPALEY